MDFLNYTFVLLNEALVSFSRIVLSYGMDISVCLLWIGLSIATFTYFFYNLKATLLSGFVTQVMKKGKYLNEGALGGPFHRVWKMKQIENLGRLLVECEDNNRDICLINVAEANQRWKRALLENIVGLKFNWEQNGNLCHPNPMKARQARRTFVGRNNWSRFKELPPNHRKAFFKLAAKL